VVDGRALRKRRQYYNQYPYSGSSYGMGSIGGGYPYSGSSYGTGIMGGGGYPYSMYGSNYYGTGMSQYGYGNPSYGSCKWFSHFNFVFRFDTIHFFC
jgi:hypothetical protein